MARGADVPDDPATELRYIRAELAVLRAMIARHQLETRVMHMRMLRLAPPRHGWLRYVVKDLEPIRAPSTRCTSTARSTGGQPAAGRAAVLSRPGPVAQAGHLHHARLLHILLTSQQIMEA